MDALKTATTTQQSGEEPLSGAKGAGTASEPYDQGNAQGSDGAPPNEGMGGAMDDTKKAASDAAAGQSL